MNNKELVQKLVRITEKKTVYMWGTFGAPVTEKVITNKSRQYPSWYSATKQKALRSCIGKGYYAFDCIGLIKAILWGWDGSSKTANGGAVYLSNNIPDTNANGFINRCLKVSTDFKKIELGEVVWMSGHIGVYIGNGRVIEATPAWANGVQITKLSARDWIKHGLIPQLQYYADKPDANEVLVTTANLHMRDGAGKSHKSMMVIPKGAEVQVYSKSNEWAEVLYNDKMGFCSLAYLKFVESRESGKVIAHALNVRSGPGNQYRIQKVLKLGEAVEILDSVNGWYKIRFGTGTAFVSRNYIEESTEVSK